MTSPPSNYLGPCLPYPPTLKSPTNYCKEMLANSGGRLEVQARDAASRWIHLQLTQLVSLAIQVSNAPSLQLSHAAFQP
jgi:hypothetical protein